ncbi:MULTISPECIES: anthranilate phosphoribosyltransferase [Legionella]|uniref:Anthranilate phosphoribosyltransferase n=1 Tax=Legionella maceachernii TaxID=466 RepID=A0A0W0VY73_9GAMM|nr:anthranilate phosphoribosyltransferase [Legionella maceachernii]KTD24937.1 anthranilate phosphoribosyltransferase [Legionella maceachernii]SKA16615.1 anthranilate phosphoribosyltransferase [Legionella maceachernii]SUP01683.1 Anthranilate phosphoribosyltransferase [Legionella maceachernii]
MKINNLLEQLIADEHLTISQMQELMHACMRGDLTDAQFAAFLVLMRKKGETVDELTAAAKVMMEFAHCIDLGDDLIDIVGTGGDGKNTFNVSTISSFVAAAAGAHVAKHGGRSVSGRSGSADLLFQAEFELYLTDDQLAQCMQQCGISFLFAPHFHQAMQHARQVRQQLGIRTLFNILGPLVNPARVKKQVMGVFAKHWLEPLAKVLANLGRERALVIHSHDGMDEVSIAAITDVVEYHHGHFKHWSIDPKEHGCFHATLDAIIVDSPAESLALADEVFNGTRGPARDIVLLNAASALYCAELAESYAEAVRKAELAIDSGEAARRFTRLKELTRTLTGKS